MGFGHWLFANWVAAVHEFRGALQVAERNISSTFAGFGRADLELADLDDDEPEIFDALRKRPPPKISIVEEAIAEVEFDVPVVDAGGSQSFAEGTISDDVVVHELAAASMDTEEVVDRFVLGKKVCLGSEVDQN
jgi:hypothetical protein